LSHEHHLAPVNRIRQRAADQGKDNHGQDARKPDTAEGNGVLVQLVDVPK